MQILKYVDTINRGGAEIQVLDICRNGARLGLEITLVTRGGTLEDEFAATGIDLVKVERRLPIDPILIRTLRRLIREKRPAILHGYQSVDSVHLYLASLRLDPKHVLSFQGFIKAAREKKGVKFLIPRVDANVLVSKSIRIWLEQERGLRFGDNARVIYNGADPARLAPQGNSLKAELGLSSETRLIGMIGNFYRDERKDQMTVCRALPEVFSRFDDVHCIFAGLVEPGAEHKLEECRRICTEAGIVDRVHFLGPRSDVPDILSELSIFTFSSLHEGLPVAVSESMLAGVPMIVSDIGPLLEASDNGRVARVFAVGDHAALGRHVVDLLSKPAELERLRDLALRHAQDNFSIDAHLRQLTTLYNELQPQSQLAI